MVAPVALNDQLQGMPTSSDQIKPLSVGAITKLIKGAIEPKFGDLWIEGEISNYVHHSSGHRYFKLKDDQAILPVAMWRSFGEQLRFQPSNGQRVLIYGDISVYEKGGYYQLSAKTILPVGIGPLELAFRQLFERLSKEGLFDDERKQELPLYPKRIGLVTSPTGAAVRDFLQIAKRRNNLIDLIIAPAKVQGDGAEVTVVAAIEQLNASNLVDLIVVMRGGGSLEDLWTFNTEPVVRAIAASRIPVVSAIGHEIDTTLSDHIADLRAPTPSAAAELVIWDRIAVQNEIQRHMTDLMAALRRRAKLAREQIDSLVKRPLWRRPEQLYAEHRQRLDQLLWRFAQSGKKLVEGPRHRLSLHVAKLEALSPLQILSRGYSVTVLSSDQSVLRESSQVEVGSEIETIVSRGRVRSTVYTILSHETLGQKSSS